MPQYQIRLLDSGGLKTAIHDPECGDDFEAMALAKGLISGGGMAHVWEGPRNVGQVFLPLPLAAE